MAAAPQFGVDAEQVPGCSRPSPRLVSLSEGFICLLVAEPKAESICEAQRKIL